MDEKSGKKKKIPKKLKIFLSAVLTVIAVLLIVMTAALKLGNVTVTTFTSNVKAYFMQMGSGDGYPYDIDADSVKDINIYNTNLFLLLDDKTTVLTSTAKEIMPKKHTFINPAMNAKDGRVIVYDLDSGNFRIQKSSEIIHEGSMQNRILAAAIGRKGNYALGTVGDNVMSVLTVFGDDNKEDFIWNFPSERISDISLSDNGKYAAVSTVFSENGKMSSKVYVFSFSSEEYVSCTDFKSSVILNVDYSRDNDVVVIGDNIRSYISNGKTRKKDVSFSSDVLHNYCMTENGRSANVISKYGSASLSSLSVYSDTGKEQFGVDFDKEVKWLALGDKYTAVLFENEVRTYNKKGKQVGSIGFTGEPLKVAVDGSKIYVLTSVSLQCYNAKGSQKAD